MFIGFYRAMPCIARIMLQQDVCLSAGIATLFLFFHTKRCNGNNPTGTFLREPSNAWGMKKIAILGANISLYLRNDTRYSHSYYGNVNRKPHSSYQIVSFSITLSDLE